MSFCFNASHEAKSTYFLHQTDVVLPCMKSRLTVNLGCHGVTSPSAKDLKPDIESHLLRLYSSSSIFSLVDDFTVIRAYHVLDQKNMMIREVFFFISVTAANLACECDCPLPEAPKTGEIW